MNFLDKPLNHDNESSIPPYPFSGYDNTEELDKDVEYMKGLYSRALRMIQQEVPPAALLRHHRLGRHDEGI